MNYLEWNSPDVLIQRAETYLDGGPIKQSIVDSILVFPPAATGPAPPGPSESDDSIVHHVDASSQNSRWRGSAY